MPPLTELYHEAFHQQISINLFKAQSAEAIE